ncbi:hypothetical protein [Chroococcidiopsis sp. CCALA 051]|nr:hypothetical protein [Chroococcidiopsis sp. CCALA 051]
MTTIDQMHSVETGSPGKVNTFVTHTATVAWAIATLTAGTGLPLM